MFYTHVLRWIKEVICTKKLIFNKMLSVNENKEENKVQVVPRLSHFAFYHFSSCIFLMYSNIWIHCILFYTFLSSPYTRTLFIINWRVCVPVSVCLIRFICRLNMNFSLQYAQFILYLYYMCTIKFTWIQCSILF